MRVRDRSSWVFVVTALLGPLAACGPVVTGGGTEGESEGSTGSTDDSPNPTLPSTTTSDPSAGSGDVTGHAEATSLPPLDTGPDTDGGGDGCCEPHSSPGCNEPDVVNCVCKQEAFCCAFEWSESCVDMAVRACMATCEDPGTTTDEPTTTGEPGGACTELLQIEMYPADATHTGGWGLVMSNWEPYEVSGYNQMQGQGSILYEPDIPCDDTWYIWVRYWDQNSQDSYFATVDGEPVPPAIFEGDCTSNDPPGANPYAWRLLNWRDPQNGGPCQYVADPWAPEWTAGVHQLEFSYRESIAMGRIIITNDASFAP
jgi:hypothetical protein